MSVPVSVVIPTYNGCDFLEATLLSVIPELLAGDELLIVDDCSTDGTRALAERTLERSCNISWKVLSTLENQGPPAARNTGICAARGDIIMSVDQDDLWATGHRRTLVEALSSVDIASGRARFELSHGTESPVGNKWWRDNWLSEPQQLCEFGTSAIWRCCFEHVGLLDEAFRFGGDDVEWFSRAQTAGLIRREIPEVVLVRRIHQGNLSGKSELRQELLDVVRHHLRRGH